MWQQRATSAEDRQKGCLANGRKMEEPRWLQSWFGKSEGRASVTLFIICMAVSSAERRQRESLGKASRRGEKKSKEGKDGSFHNKTVAK